MTEEQNSDEVSFQLYIDAIKEKKIPWNTFVKLMKDFYYPDLEKLERLNSMISMEMTKSYSFLERSRYLNTILLNELKISIEEQNVEDNMITEPIMDSQDFVSIDHESKEQFDTNNYFTNDLRNEEYAIMSNHEQEIVKNEQIIKEELKDNEIQGSVDLLLHFTKVESPLV